MYMPPFLFVFVDFSVTLSVPDSYRERSGYYLLLHYPFRFYQTTFFIKQLHRVGLHLKNGLLLVCSKGLKQLL